MEFCTWECEVFQLKGPNQLKTPTVHVLGAQQSHKDTPEIRMQFPGISWQICPSWGRAALIPSAGWDQEPSTGSGNSWVCELFWNANMWSTTTHQNRKTDTTWQLPFWKTPPSSFSATDTAESIPGNTFLQIPCHPLQPCLIFHILQLLPRRVLGFTHIKAPNCLFFFCLLFFKTRGIWKHTLKPVLVSRPIFISLNSKRAIPLKTVTAFSQSIKRKFNSLRSLITTTGDTEHKLCLSIPQQWNIYILLSYLFDSLCKLNVLDMFVV